MDKIEFKKRIRLDCASLQTFPASIVQFMPTTLTRLTIAQVNPRSCHGEINKQVFGTDPQSVFVHLRLLCVQVCCSNSNLYDFQSFVPERFPILSNFVLGVPKQCCNGNEDSPLVTIFSSKQWPSISSLRLIGDDTKVPDIGRLLFEAMPALRSCIFRYMYTIDVSSSLISCLGISELSLIATILETSHVLGRFACLVYLELKYMDIDSSYLKFIASCPRLVEIKLTDCDITNDAIAAVYNYPCNSVRKVVISKDNEDTFTDHIAYILPAFPNLRILDLTGIDREETRMSFILKCPAVKIIT
ncbi:hypothetical protein GQ42DRAFT_5924 [Ramicandelaber brevisporus]|nr:hypothetical protein GQ42DRAFT_5924 [Ramicandelaber brevisporus]